MEVSSAGPRLLSGGTNLVGGSPPTVEFGRNLNDGRIEAAIGSNGADLARPHDRDHAEMIDLAAALDRLDPKDRMIVGVRFVGGFESAEIGQAMGMSRAIAEGARR